MEPEPIVAVTHVNAPPEMVYEYFIRPDLIVAWMGGDALLEPERGGRFAVDVRGAPVRGRYLELDPPHRLVISWGYAGAKRLPSGASTVEVRFIAEDAGTRVELEHRGLPRDEQPGHTSGWAHYLKRLSSAATGSDPGPDPGMPAAQRPPVRGRHRV